MADHVEFLGYRSDVLDLVGAMDFFVLPSCGEAFGLALIEGSCSWSPQCGRMPMVVVLPTSSEKMD